LRKAPLFRLLETLELGGGFRRNLKRASRCYPYAFGQLENLRMAVTFRLLMALTGGGGFRRNLKRASRCYPYANW